jgi:2,3-dihydroxyphenylpropionate 1,2-dioxygenase
MSDLIGFVGISHSPFATLLPPEDRSRPGGAFLADARRVAEAVSTLQPDAVVLIGPDHFHANFYDVMPPFVIGVEEAEGFGDYGSTPGPLKVQSGLAWSVYEGLADRGFDPALSYSLTVDHGIVQSYEMVCGFGVPLVPIVTNTAAPPLPSLDRCIALGEALGDTLREADGGRVVVIASGGLSHWLPSNDPRDPSVQGERRDALIHGRADTRAFAAAREPRVRAMGGNPDARVNAEWDGWFLDRLRELDLGSVASLGHRGLEEAAGSGGHEVRTWLIGAAAVARPVTWTAYEPVPEWVTGMGIAASFEI